MKKKKYLCSQCLSIFSLPEVEKNCPNCGKKLLKKDLMPTLAKFKARTWIMFSKYIRLKRCLETTGSSKSGICYTCGRTYDFKALQAGHMVAGRKDKVLFDEEYVDIQCYACNMHLHGNQGLFALKKMKELVDDGMSYEEAYEEIYAAFNRDDFHYSYEQLIDLYKKYSKAYDELLEVEDDS